jgi:hypothetical protein
MRQSRIHDSHLQSKDSRDFSASQGALRIHVIELGVRRKSAEERMGVAEICSRVVLRRLGEAECDDSDDDGDAATAAAAAAAAADRRSH